MSVTAFAQARPEHGSRVARLDGLRGLAVLAVVWTHLSLHMGIVPWQGGGGYVGVLAFFMLSGYLITQSLWCNEHAATWRGYRRFVGRRIQRLAPALLGLVFIGGPALVLLGRELPSQAVKGALLALVQGTAFFNGHLDAPWGPTWSLTVEWTFYLWWPLVLLALRRSGQSLVATRRVALAIASLLYFGALVLLPDRQFYLLPVANLAVMVCGGALAITHLARAENAQIGVVGRDPMMSNLGAVLLALMVALPGAPLGSAYRWILMPSAVIAVLLVLDHRPEAKSLISTILTWAPLRAVGVRAYSIYLWHVPLMWIAWFGLDGLPVAIRAVVALFALVPVASVSFALLERPWMRGLPLGSHRRSKKHTHRSHPVYVDVIGYEPLRDWGILQRGRSAE